jgi:DNA-directed RNA polymerase specialized sigma24 family protein
LDSTSDEHHQFQFTSDDHAQLKSFVRGKASAELSKADVDDITSEILLSACVSAASADVTAPVAALAFTYASYARYYADARKTAEAVAGADPVTYERNTPATGTATLSVEIRHVLRSLSPASRTIIWMCDVEGMTLTETATTLGVSVATAYRRLKQAHSEFQSVWNA